MAAKRSLSAINLSDSSIKTPPKKKQRISDDSLDIINNEQQILLKINTKLGDSEKIFDMKELQQIKYFNNQLSGRWFNDNICTIDCDDLYFGMDEIDTLLFYKKHNKINIQYPFDRLIYLCNAFDFFTETIDDQVFDTYFSEYIPAIQYQNLVKLKSLCCSNQYNALSTAIDGTMAQIMSTQTAINNRIIMNWSYAPIDLLISNSSIAIAVFTQNFKFRKYDDRFLFYQKPKALKAIWDYISLNKLYSNHPQVIEIVHQLQNPTLYLSRFDHQSNNIYAVISDIVMDTLQICLEEDLKYKSKENYTLICNIFDIMNVESDKLKEGFFGYDFLFVVVRKLLHLRRMDKDKFLSYFGNDIIIKLLTKKFCEITSVAKNRNIIKDIEELKVSEFSKTEQYQLFYEVFIRNFWLGLNEESLINILNSLIDIVKELPTKTSLKTLLVLINGICEYITTEKGSKTCCDQSYLNFIDQYTNVWNSV